MVFFVCSFSVNELIFIIAKSQSGCHLLITQGPIPVLIVKVLASRLKENLYRPLLLLTNDCRIDMFPANVHKAATLKG